MLDLKKKPLTLDDALAILRAHESDLKARGVKHAAIFGSLARGDARADSDVDVLLSLDRESKLGLFAYAAIVEDIGDLFARRADVANADALRPSMCESILADAVYAF
jgi:hypothetical protein